MRNLLSSLASGVVSIDNTDGFPSEVHPPRGKAIVTFGDGSTQEIDCNMNEFSAARKALGLPDKFKCVEVSRDAQRYGIPTATFHRCDGFAGDITVTGSYLMEFDSGDPIKLGDEVGILIKR